MQDQSDKDVSVPFTLSNINLNNIVYKKIKKISKNTKLVFIKYDSTNLVFQIPTIINNGVIHPNNDTISFNLKCVNIDKTTQLINFFNELDKKIINDSLNNKWFSDNLLYKKIINNNTINIKIINNNNFNTKFFLNENERITFDQIPNHAENNCNKLGTCKIILECYAVWIKKSSFSILIRPVSISFSKFHESIYNYTFIQDSDDTDENINCLDYSISDNIWGQDNEKNNLTDILDEYTTTTSN